MFEKEAEEYAEKVYGSSTEIDHYGIADAFKDGAEFGYNKSKEEMQAQEYSMSYENGIFKCKYKSGKKFESIDGETWKEIVLPELKESE